MISACVEKGLLARTDRTAGRLGITRAELISQGLSAALIAVGERWTATRLKGPNGCP